MGEKTNSMLDEISQIAEDLKTETNPIILVDYLTKLAGWAAYYEGLLQPIQMMKPTRWLEIQSTVIKTESNTVEGMLLVGTRIPREKNLSDKKTEMVWLATKEGQEEIKYTSELKKIALMSSAIRQNLWSKKIEWKNLNPNI